MADLYHSAKDVQRRYKISRSRLYRWVSNPEVAFPAPVKIGHRVLWRDFDLQEFDQDLAISQGLQSQSNEGQRHD